MDPAKVPAGHERQTIQLFALVNTILILGVVLCLYVLVQVWQTATLISYKDQIEPEPAEWPEITVMVAARNEETGIGSCLEALCHQNYPKEKLHIVVGNDQSTDNTAAIVLDFAAKHQNLKLIHIEEDHSGLKAKARVMAQLDQHAKGDYYLVTDADVVVGPDWAAALVRHMTVDTGVASGTTMVTGKGLWAGLQGVDWAYFMGLLNVISYSGIPSTAVGNNMIVRAKAYWQTGGYRNIRFSITEDYKLYSEVCRHGWKWNNIMIPEVLALSQPTIGFLPLLHQRKRWLTGGRELPWYWWILFGIFALFYFLMPFYICISPVSGAIIWLIKWLLQVVQINRIYSCTGSKLPGLGMHIAYEIYMFVVTISTALFFFAPFKTVWKGRRY